jgi:CheY-like chemotaxis protein
VAVTASVFEHERGAILSRGADDFVMKPFDEEKIFDVIASRLGVRFRRENDVSVGTRVLLVDDEAISRRVAGELLLRLGLEVTEATGGTEALALLDAAPLDAPFHAVLLDLKCLTPTAGAHYRPSANVSAGVSCRSSS